MPVAAIRYASPSAIPADMPKCALMAYTGVGPADVARLDGGVYSPTMAVPADHRRLGVVLYYPGDVVPGDMRRVVITKPSSPDISAVLAIDTFDRVDSAVSLGTASDGGAWTADVGTWGISSNKGYLASVTGDASASRPAGGTDYVYEVDITTSPTVDRTYAGVTVRVSGNNYLVFILQKRAAINRVDLLKNLGGVYTNVFSNTSAGLTDNTTYRIRFELSGDTVRVYKAGVLQVTYTITDAALRTGTAAGLYSYRSAGTDDGLSRFDNFSVTAYPT